MYNGNITISAGCSPLSFTCQGSKIFPAGENEAMNGACCSFPLKPIFAFGSVGCVRTSLSYCLVAECKKNQKSK